MPIGLSHKEKQPWALLGVGGWEKTNEVYAVCSSLRDLDELNTQMRCNKVHCTFLIQKPMRSLESED